MRAFCFCSVPGVYEADHPAFEDYVCTYEDPVNKHKMVWATIGDVATELNSDHLIFLKEGEVLKDLDEGEPNHFIIGIGTGISMFDETDEIDYELYPVVSYELMRAEDGTLLPTWNITPLDEATEDFDDNHTYSYRGGMSGTQMKGKGFLELFAKNYSFGIDGWLDGFDCRGFFETATDKGDEMRGYIGRKKIKVDHFVPGMYKTWEEYINQLPKAFLRPRMYYEE